MAAKTTLALGTTGSARFYAFIFIGTLYMQQVLGYSALHTGLAWLATSVTSVALARALAETRHPHLARAGDGARDAPDRGGILCATLVPVHGHFWANLAGPLLVTGAEVAFAFVPVSIGGLAGAAKQEAGLASGLLSTSQQLGGAISVAIVSTGAATHLSTLLGQGKPANVALTGGFHLALLGLRNDRPARAASDRHSSPPPHHSPRQPQDS